MDEQTGWYTDNAATFGDRIVAAREALGMSQTDLARRIGVRSATLEAWEDDRAEPRANRLQMMAGILNVSLAWLLTGEGEGVPAPSSAASDGGAEILTEMRQLRTEAARTVERLGVLEKRLRTLLGEGAA